MTKISTTKDKIRSEVKETAGVLYLCDKFYDAARTQKDYSHSFLSECPEFPRAVDRDLGTLAVGDDFGWNSDYYRVTEVKNTVEVRYDVPYQMDSWPKEWIMGKEGQLSQRIGKILIIAERGFYHEFPIKGKYVKSKNGSHLFFADEEKGTDLLTKSRSRENGRFFTDELIYEMKEQEGVKFFRYFAGFRYEVK